MAKKKPSTIRYLRLSCVLLILTLCCYFDRHGSTKSRAKVQQLKWPQQHALSSSTMTTTTTTTTTTATTSSSLSFHHLPHDMGFIHIGKTGGATVARNIRRACTSRRACRAKIQALVAPTNWTEESQISRHVSAYYHMRKVSSSRYHSSYLVTVRDPLDRVASWYIFRHPANAHFLDVSPTQNVDLRTLFACYPTLDSLVTRGLSIHPYPKQQQQETNNDDDECSQLAQSIVGGTMQPPRRGDHMGWNYEFYLRDILLLTQQQQQQQQQKPLIFVIRTEFLWQDWITIEQVLGGRVAAAAAAAAGNHNDDNSTTNDTMAPTKNVSHKRHDSSTPLPVSNTTMSKQGVNNLCRILGREIDVYARVLQRAVNLEPGQVQESLQRVHDKCRGTRRKFKK